MWNNLYLAIAAVFLVQGETSGQLAVGIPEPTTAAMASMTTTVIAAAETSVSGWWLVAAIIIAVAAAYAVRKRFNKILR